MSIQTAVSLLADAKTPGLLAMLPPWALVLSGIALMLLASLLFWVNKEKLDDDSFPLEMAATLCVIGGFVALLTGLFGGW